MIPLSDMLADPALSTATAVQLFVRGLALVGIAAERGSLARFALFVEMRNAPDRFVDVRLRAGGATALMPEQQFDVIAPASNEPDSLSSLAKGGDVQAYVAQIDRRGDALDALRDGLLSLGAAASPERSLAYALNFAVERGFALP